MAVCKYLTEVRHLFLKKIGNQFHPDEFRQSRDRSSTTKRLPHCHLIRAGMITQEEDYTAG